MKQITCYLAARAREASTWQALTVFLTAIGLHLTPEQQAAIGGVGLAVFVALGAFFPDRLGKPQTRSTDQGDQK